MMLLTPDEGKEPLVYAIDDLAKAAAKETDMQEEKEDLSVMLAKAQQEIEAERGSKENIYNAFCVNYNWK